MKDYTIYVTEEIAKKAMEKGFEFTASDEYDTEETIFNIGSHHPICEWVKLPTAEQICGWLRDNGYNVEVRVNDMDSYDLHVVQKRYNIYTHSRLFIESYEEALLEGINKALDLI